MRPVLDFHIAFAAIALLCMGGIGIQQIGCKSSHQSPANGFDPLPYWFNEELRDSVYKFYARRLENYSPEGFTGASIDAIHLLAWQQFSYKPNVPDDHRRYQAMLWIHMTLPDSGTQQWSVARIWGMPGDWRLTQTSGIHRRTVHFNHPPTNEEIYATQIWDEFFEPVRGWRIYDGYLRSNTWEALTGKKPTRKFVTIRP